VSLFARVFTAAVLVCLCPAAASACMVTPFARVIEASEVIVEGRFFHDPTNPEIGHIEPSRVERGTRRDRYEIRWSIAFLESPEGECATQIPANGHYGRFYLRARKGGHFHMIGRAWVKDPDAPEEIDE
jgi:hypothetical protein